MQELLSRPKGSRWLESAHLQHQSLLFKSSRGALPHGAGSSAVLLSDGNLCYRVVELRDAK